ncbi:hypothetical protein Q1695_003562 [Nippostrongylus brasiliensis]|nr:hypothetical protein Q1695_003562 [Nippostrongylus brasiliensis]
MERHNIKDMFELTGVTFVGMRRLRYNKPQSMLVTRIPAPPGAQANRQVITALKGVGAGISAFLEERQGEDLIRRAREHAQQRAEDARAGGEESEAQGQTPSPPEAN